MNEVMMDRDYKEKLEMKEHVRIPKRVYISRENIKEFEFRVRCPGRTSMLMGTAGHAHVEALSKTNGRERRVKEYHEQLRERSQLLKRYNRGTKESSSTAAPSSSANEGSDPARMAKRTNIERIPSVANVELTIVKRNEEEEGK